MDGVRVLVWTAVTEGATTAAVHRATMILSAGERARAAGLIAGGVRRDYILAHALLRRCLSARWPIAPGDWKFADGAGGKPFLTDHPTIAFSLSHTRGVVACAVSESVRIGVDVERLDEIDTDAIAARSFDADEQRQLFECVGAARQRLFYELWTLKESFAKAVGLGLALRLDSTSFARDQEGRIRVRLPQPCRASEWHFSVHRLSAVAVLALATESAQPPRVEVVDRSADFTRLERA